MKRLALVLYGLFAACCVLAPAYELNFGSFGIFSTIICYYGWVAVLCWIAAIVAVVVVGRRLFGNLKTPAGRVENFALFAFPMIALLMLVSINVVPGLWVYAGGCP